MVSQFFETLIHFFLLTGHEKRRKHPGNLFIMSIDLVVMLNKPGTRKRQIAQND